MPFIRYAPGDMAIKSDKKCDCGRSFPMIEKIIGRTSDVIKLINGRVLNGLSIPFEELTTEVDKFQIVQEASDRVEVLLVPRGELTVISNFACTIFGKVECTENGNMACT
jgi:phenylacetate-CoA ligase